MTVTIKSIKAQNVLNKNDFNYIVEHLNQPLELADLWFNRVGTLEFMTVRSKEEDHVITLFENNGITFDINGTEELACTHTI